ncbi:MAG: preprotein translocase subunit SecA [Synergistetes bacterium HGW-Synergistetes-1]|nr:MAG: preprotein translocase subunit SecA [Synergistetes bacterium HGW-Synergistetes-1]
MFSGVIKALGLDPNDRAIARYEEKASIIDSFEPQLKDLTDEELAQSASFFKARLENGETLDDMLPEVFARVREVSVRTLGLRHFKEQLMGGMALHEGKIAEMKTGEGKTLVATLAVALNAIAGRGVHVITVNDYLAARDAEWMGPVYRGMGLSVGVISPFMDQEDRFTAYRKDITYGTNSEFGFDYLRDNMAIQKDQQVQKGHFYCIVDEVDSILIDEARTPLIISGPSEDDTEPYRIADSVARELIRGTDFEIEEKERNLALTETGIAKAERLMKLPNLFTDFANSSLSHKIAQSLKAHHLFQRDVHYVVKDGEIVIVDEFTGRLMFGRRYSDGLHQAIEAKERVKVGRENQTLATITLQNYFRMYEKLAGMTGTALTEAEEFKEIYGLEVILVPTHMPMVRQDHHDAIYRTVPEKYNAAADEVSEAYEKGQPVLVGTTSIENSEKVSRLLRARKIPHSVLNAKVHDKEASIVAQAGRLKAVTVATNMAGRGTDIVLGGNAEFMAREEMQKKGLSIKDNDEEYKNVLEEYKKLCTEEHEAVIKAGGLRIIGTERHESRRIDNQLRGRSGRQGDPGESRFYIALEDDLIRLFGGDRVQGIMEKLGMEEGECIEHTLLSRAIENAQKKVEEMHFDIRKQLLAYDNVMNQQREALYKERSEILNDKDIASRMLGVLEDTAQSLLDKVFGDNDNAEPDIQSVSVKLNALFWPGMSKHIENVETKEDLDQAKPVILEDIRSRFTQKTEDLGPEVSEQIFRYIFLEVLDTNWKEHLLAMDELRRGIGLRAIGQKDPLLEYQFESFSLFQTMLVQIREGITEFALKVSVVNKEKEKSRTNWIESRDALEIPDTFGYSEDMENPGTLATAQKTQPIVNVNKVGRNDPCPCGSGKKYKQCCGR